MALRPMRPCNHPGCAALVRGESYCPRHKPAADERRAVQIKQAHRQYNTRRDDSDGFYKTERWRRLSVYYRKRHPICEECQAAVSEITDHIKPRKTHPDLSLDWDNLRALCRPCHNKVGAKVGLIDGK
ncbi:HNH endonuclease [compost metagenome]